MTTYAEASELEAGLDLILAAPKTEGIVDLVARRPREGEREVLEEAWLDPVEGLRGDDWLARATRRSPDGVPDTDTQVTLMSSR